MSDRPVPAVTISLVTWNGLRWLSGCLGSVAGQTLDDYELLVLDNGSDDGSGDWLEARVATDERITFVRSVTNLGFARGHNRNIEAARGEAVLLLNQDVELEPGFLAATVSALADHPEAGAVQARLRRLSAAGERTDVIDTTGLLMQRDRRVVSRGQLTQDAPGRWDDAGPVWGVDGAAPVYRRAALESARLPRTAGGQEVLDEDFFSYKEDVDLAWRLRRLGWTAWYEPAAIAWHARGGGDTGATGWRAVIRANMSNPPHVRALSWRNHRLMQLKNEEPKALLHDLPWIARRELQAWIFMLVADPHRLAAVPELVRGLPAARRKRRALAARSREASDPGARPRGAASSARMASRLRVTNIGRATAHLRRRGPRATVERGADELREQIWVARHGSGAVDGIHQNGAGAISARLDRPRFDGYEGSPFLGLLGWAYARAGVASVDVFLDGRRVGEATIGRARPDVTSAWKHLDEAKIEGFSAVIGLDGVAAGPRLVSVVIRDGAGHVRILSRRFRRLDAEAEYRRIAERAEAVGDSRAVVAPAGPSATDRVIQLLVFLRADGDLGTTLQSIARQRAQAWRCVIVATAASAEAAQAAGREALGPGDDARWSLITDRSRVLPETVGALDLVGFLRAGETLAPSALAELSVAGKDAGLVYADHDSVDSEGVHRDPWFVPDWSPERLLAQDYIGGAFLVRDGAELRAALERPVTEVGSDAWRYGLLLEMGASASEVRHVPCVLWSRPSADVRDAAAEAQVVRAELERRTVPSPEITTRDGHSGPVRSIVRALPDARPTVSIVVPTTGRRELVADLLELLHERTAYEPREVVVLDNSRGLNPDGIALLDEAGVVVVECDEPFNWARLSNIGAARASGELLLFLNDDMHTDDRGWLDPLVQLALEPDVGAVGPLLLYPDGTIQHAGIFLVGHGGGAAHLLQGLDPTDDLYLDLQHLTREVSAVTGACLLVRREGFEEVGGFDERFRVSGNDVDLCLRLNASGHRVLWTPQSVLFHEEGRSRRGVDYLGDEGRLWERWGDLLGSGDPYYNPNLSQDRVDCDLDWSRLFRSGGH